MRRAVGPVARDGPAAEDVGLALEPPREDAEDPRRSSATPSSRATAPCATIAGGRAGQAAEPLEDVAGDQVAGQGQHAHAPHEEEAEERQVPVPDVPDLVAEDRRDLVLVEPLDQGVGQQDVAEPRQGAR